MSDNTVHIELDSETYASLCGDAGGDLVSPDNVNDSNCHRCREIFTTPLASSSPADAARRKLERQLDDIRASNAKKYKELLRKHQVPAPHAILLARLEALLETLNLTPEQMLEFQLGFEGKMTTVLNESLAAASKHMLDLNWPPQSPNGNGHGQLILPG